VSGILREPLQTRESTSEERERTSQKNCPPDSSKDDAGGETQFDARLFNHPGE